MQDAILNARLAWDSINYQWSTWILSYDNVMQRDFFLRLGIYDNLSWKLAGMLLVGVLLVLGLIWLDLKRGTIREDAVLKIYREMCRTFEKAGLPRRVAEGPVDYEQRLCARFPERARVIRDCFEKVLDLRYGSQTGREAERELQNRVRGVQRSFQTKAAGFRFF